MGGPHVYKHIAKTRFHSITSFHHLASSEWTITAAGVILGSKGSTVMKSKSSQNSRAFSMIGTSPGQMEGKQHEHTDVRGTVVCTRAVYTSSTSV